MGMTMFTSRSAVFVSTENALERLGGGVQRCTQDYLSLLRLAGYNLEVVGFQPNRSLQARVRRRLERRPFGHLAPSGLTERIERALEKSNASLVFFNLVDFPGVAKKLRLNSERKPVLVHLSHGLDSTDISIDQQAKRHDLGVISYDRCRALSLGSKLQCEADYRRYLHASMCISPLDAELERWLGASRTAWFSRPIPTLKVASKPVEMRVGTVGTLDHPPNRHGLRAMLEALAAVAPPELRFRLVGGPVEFGESIARAYPVVEYLGRLSEQALEREAATWRCFVHPVFHYARGCSTKVAMAMAWQLPIASTKAGARGYHWDEEILPLCDSPSELAVMTVERSEGYDFKKLQDQTRKIAQLQPGQEELASQIRRYLDEVERAASK